MTKEQREEYKRLVSNLTDGMHIVPDGNGWYKYEAVPQPEITVKDYETAVDAHIDAVARENDFTSILHCTKYSGFENEFRVKAERLLAWNAACWVKCHEVMNAVNAGTRTAPTIEELIAELPELKV